MNEHATPEANQSPPSATEEEEENPIAQSPTQAQEPAQKAVEDYPPGLTKILQSALEQGASHVHLEPHNEDYRLRFRVGGILNEINHYSEKEAGLIIQRLFVQASLESDMRRPQDGIFNFSWKDAKYAIRVSSYPCGRGPKTVLKISKAASLLTFENLGMSAEQVLAVRQLMRRRGGLIIVTGPWSSGKTATMYAIGHEFNKAELNVATIEDPIELDIPGLNQGQVDPQHSFGFPEALRSILHQDPDIVLVGEISDYATGKRVMDACLQAGHRVITSIHTDNVLGTLHWLNKLGLRSDSVAHALSGIVVQRLVRRVCSHCAETVAPGKRIREQVGFDISTTGKYRQGKGCDACSHTGYLGKTGVFEIVPIKQEMRDLIAENAPDVNLKRALRKLGIESIRRSGIKKAEEGITTVNEIVRVT